MQSFEAFCEQADRGQIEALADWANNLHEPGIRLHISKSRTINMRTQGQYIAPGFYRMNGKPIGLWYAIGDEWLRFIVNEYPNGIGNYIYSVEINPSRIIFVNDEKTSHKLETEFGQDSHLTSAWGDFKPRPFQPLYHGRNPEPEMHPYMLNWQKMARDYWGIEVDPYKVWDAWVEEWGVHSGCIWNKRGLKSINLIAYYDPKTRRYLTLNSTVGAF